MGTEHNFYKKGANEVMIIKSNTLVEAGYDLTEAEQDLMTLAVNKLHHLKSGSRRVMISAQEFAAANRVNEVYAYRALKDTAKILGDRKLRFTLYIDKNIQAEHDTDKLTVIKPNHDNYTTLRSEYSWLQGVMYQDQQGFIILDFSDPLKFLIENTSKSYTRYDFIKTVEFTGSSSKRLYELISKWKDIGKVPPMTVEAWKDIFGVSDKYPKIAEFRRRVLDPAIEQINKQGDYHLTLESQRTGRSISHLELIIKQKRKTNKEEKADSKCIKLLTTSQAQTFAKKLANDSGFGSNFARIGESSNDFLSRLIDELQRDKNRVSDYMPYLIKLGFK
ncbi:RepB family plasmid replication initiator protein [Moraxella osloensis]|nr:RepB family plasmid replication initiator protein [Moraxella osloensis]MDK1671147.1 RepB family plasmid replication initiator protein [Moraxella osloensis]